MISDSRKKGPFPSAYEDAASARRLAALARSQSPSYRLAFQDEDFLLRPELRPIRLQLELLKPELVQQEQHIEATVVIFGSARIRDPESAQAELVTLQLEARRNPADKALNRRLAGARRDLGASRYYEEARRLGRLISGSSGRERLVVVTGGGPGVMEAANRGAFETGAPSVGMNVVLPHEQAPNPYLTPELAFQFHYFAIRKMHLLMRAKALVAFPGGFGTFDELFETLTLVQTGKIKALPVLLFGRSFWERAIDFPMLVAEGFIAEEDLGLFRFVESAAEAWQIIRRSLCDGADAPAAEACPG
jgi:hypothetical protein